MMSGREEMDRLMIGKCFTDQGLDTQIYASYAAQQLWGTCKRILLLEFILHMVILNYYIVLYISFMTYIELLYCLILYATHQLWGRHKRKLCSLRPLFKHNRQNDIEWRELNSVAFVVYIFLHTRQLFAMYTRGGPELNYSIRFVIRTAATNIVKPREGIAEKKLLEA